LTLCIYVDMYMYEYVYVCTCACDSHAADGMRAKSCHARSRPLLQGRPLLAPPLTSSPLPPLLPPLSVYTRMLDEAIVMIETQAKPLCTELAAAVASYRGMSADFAASLLAQLSRSLTAQESMAAVARKVPR
jgi:hypothetical protein